MPQRSRPLYLLYATLGFAELSRCIHGFVPPPLVPQWNCKKRAVVMSTGSGAEKVIPEGYPELIVNAHFVAKDEERMKTLSKSLVSSTRGRVAVRLRPQADSVEGEEEEEGVSGGVSGGGSSNSGGGEFVNDGCLPAFRFEREGIVIDEYHTHGDAPYEEELAKRVEAALSLSRREDAATLKELWSPDAADGHYRDEMAVATYVVQVASHVARELQEELCQAEAISKMDSSPVTVADFTVQAIVLGLLRRYFPGHGFIAEEMSSVLRQDQSSLFHVLSVVSQVLGQKGLTEADLCAAIDLGGRGHGKHERGHWGKGGRTWVLDPIDGTKGFLRGEQFCVALGLLDGGKAVAGILGCPNLPAGGEHPPQGPSGWGTAGEARGLLYTAALGEGTFVRALSAGADDSRRVFVDHARKPGDTRVLESVEAGHTSHAVAAQVCSDLGITLPSIRVDGQAKYGLLSEGQGGIYLRLPRWGYQEWIWDHLAGVVVISEAGGKVTDTRGQALDFSLGAKLPREVVGVVATSGKIHANVLRAVHNRQLEDWARVVAEAKAKSRGGGSSRAPSLPGVDWTPLNDGGGGNGGETWQATALSQGRPLVMRTSEQFYGTLERGWDKLVAVLFHGSWTQESQHAVSILESLAHQQQKQEQQEQRRDCSAPTTPAAAAAAAVAAAEPPPPSSWPIPTAPESSLDQGMSAKATTLLPKPQEEEQRVDGLQILLAEANVMSLIDVADRESIGGIPSLHLFSGGREILRIPVDAEESVESLGKQINEVAIRFCQAGRSS